MLGIKSISISKSSAKMRIAGCAARVVALIVVCAICVSIPLLAQELPDTPRAEILASVPIVHALASAAPAGPRTPGEEETKGTATVSGTVLDSNGTVVAGAYVAIESASGKVIFTMTSGLNGEFNFTGLPPGVFKVTVSVPRDGWGTYTSPEFQLHPRDFQLVTGVVVPITSSVSVRVSADPVELAQEQVQIALRQRVFGVFPNFFTSYDPNAPPLQSKQKFHLALRTVVDPVEFANVAGIAGIEHFNGNFHSFGGGVEGYARRYGSAYAGIFTSRILANAVFPSIFHQDPRYFYLGAGSSVRTRTFHAISGPFIARGDNGLAELNYSRILASFTSAAMSNLYYNAEDRGIKLTMINAVVHLGDYAASNLIREFVLERITTKKVPKLASKP